MSQQGRLVDLIGELRTLTGDTGGAVGPDGAQNIDIVGAAPIVVNGNPGTNTLTIADDGTIATSFPVDSGGPGVPSTGAISFLGNTATDFTNSSGLETHVGATTNEVYIENKRWFSEFIVDPSSTVGIRGEYTTVQSAIDAASLAGGGIVYVREGTYVEDLTLAADVTLIGIQANLGNKVQIHGTVTVEYAGRVDIENLYFVSTGASLFVSTLGTPQLLLTNCFFVTATGTVCSSANASLGIIVEIGGFIATFADIFAMTAGFLTIRYSNISAFLGARKRILAAGTAVYDFRFNIINHAIETQGTASFSLFNNTLDSTTTSTFNINSAGSTISSFNNNVGCTAASGNFAIGTGTFAYGEITLPGTAKNIIGTLTQDVADSRARCTAAATAGTVIIGTCGFDSGQFIVTDGFAQLGVAVATTFNADSGSAVPTANVLTLAGGTNITTTAAGTTVTINANTQSQTVNLTLIDDTDSPYTVLATDYYLSSNVSAGVLTIDLPDAPTTGRIFAVKDSGGDAGTNNITVTTTGGAVTIDGATTFVMNTNFQSANFLFNGTSYEVF